MCPLLFRRTSTHLVFFFSLSFAVVCDSVLTMNHTCIQIVRRPHSVISLSLLFNEIIEFIMSMVERCAQCVYARSINSNMFQCVFEYDFFRGQCNTFFSIKIGWFDFLIPIVHSLYIVCARWNTYSKSRKSYV